jgi:hypothetical protein
MCRYTCLYVVALLQGAEQLACDCDVLLAVFGQFTARPAAHFKEMGDACKLLRVGTDDALQLLKSIKRRGQGSEVAVRALQAIGVRTLNAEQAAVVLTQRLDLVARRGVTNE